MSQPTTICEHGGWVKVQRKVQRCHKCSNAVWWKLVGTLASLILGAMLVDLAWDVVIWRHFGARFGVGRLGFLEAAVLILAARQLQRVSA